MSGIVVAIVAQVDPAQAVGECLVVHDLENREGTPVYVHAKVVVDDVWAMVGSDNLDRRSRTHDNELSIAVLDADIDPRAPWDPAGLGDGAQVFARDRRLRLAREHLDREPSDVADLLEPQDAFEAFRWRAQRLAAWHDGGEQGVRPPGRVLAHEPGSMATLERVRAEPVYRMVLDPDGRPWRTGLAAGPDEVLASVGHARRTGAW